MEIQFVCFTRKYPCLCSGPLTLLIDGKETTFGNSRKFPCGYPAFWDSGGIIYLNDNGDGKYYVTEGEWEIREDWLPDFLKPYSEELAEIMNRSVPHGHCGGCS